jgi:mannonate dehydratase
VAIHRTWFAIAPLISNIFMKLGFGFYRHQLNGDNIRFARQCGATHAVVHMVDYFHGGGAANSRGDQPTGGKSEGWGLAGAPGSLWTVEEMHEIKRLLASEGLVWEAIENLDPGHWHDVLLGGPKRDAQLEDVRTLIGRMGEVGIPILGYNFSLAGVSSRIKTNQARGGAGALALDGGNETPVPLGMVWNMIYDEQAPEGIQPACSHEELWERVKVFLNAVLPTAETAGVSLAAHPDDPPLPELRGTPRLVYKPDLYDKLISLNPSPSNKLEFCLGTIAEMEGSDVYVATRHYAAQNRIGYIHFRNIRGKVPHYHEEFVDAGDIDMRRILRILHDSGFDGVVIPDHTPQMTCAAPWHAGMAYAMGWMRAALMEIGSETHA